MLCTRNSSGFVFWVPIRYLVTQIEKLWSEYSFVGSKNIIWNIFCLIFIVSIMCMQGGKITQFDSPSFALENRNVNTGAGGWCSAGELCQWAVTTNIYTNTIHTNKTYRGRTGFWLEKLQNVNPLNFTLFRNTNNQVSYSFHIRDRISWK